MSPDIEVKVESPIDVATAPALHPHQSSHSRKDGSSHSSSSRHSHRSFTDPDPSGLRIKKRIIVCCDGTWQDGIAVTQRYLLTNVLHLARAIEHVDKRFNPPRPQIVFYQSGVGTESYGAVDIFEGATGAGLGDKVQEAYAFIAHNYEPGDEVFLFGFSRGAYTARMVGMVIEHIGVLDRTDMDSFAQIFLDLIARGKTSDKEELQALDAKLKPWTQPDSPGKRRATFDENTFAIKCIGVFDTVGALGIPDELKFGILNDKIRTLFGFPDSVLGPHVEQAYQALAIEETRKDFICNKFHQSEEGKLKGQILKQCWFTGSHCDVGGGFPQHDLSDISLFWMVSQIEAILAIDVKYLMARLQPSAPWGEQPPHSATTGIYALATPCVRPLPTGPNAQTHETIHSSVLKQKHIPANVRDLLHNHPELIKPLLPLEDMIKANWPYDPATVPGQPPKTSTSDTDGKIGDRRKSLLARTKDAIFGNGTDTVTNGTLPPPSPAVNVDTIKRSNSKSGTWRLSLTRAKALTVTAVETPATTDDQVRHMTSFSYFSALVIDVLRAERRTG